ncbi:hypothetical protein [Caenispirillum bisanense]|uniref:Uncharacterized protein n=1 Tax=Caenispirillum bisanense TaxID=414052 RepID=A0A286GE42_9PROT|nr:hypothetical protein [Caenispirillum bisanense]SOD93284.1 hypothetical protein SAMN05421508_10315 [Caenispirillum bisanense]
MAKEEQSTQDAGPSIYLDVRKSLDVRKLDAGKGANWDREFIQRTAFARLKKIVEEQLERAESTAKSSHPTILDRRHGAITIHGTRGSGKTTFVLNALDHLCEEKGGDLVSLGVIDPTLIGSKENLFLLILNRIQQKVCEAPQWRENAAGRDWEDALRKLAGGLCLLDGVGKDRQLADDQWEDAHYAMDQGLRKAGEGQSLEANFHDMIAKALVVLKKQAFIVALDDIDTNFEQGWTVLEILRRYLTSPRMIVVLSGDMDLYAMLVRGRQWEQFSEGLLRHDHQMAGPVETMVSHLQGQYLQKILPPAYRISLAKFSDVHDTVKIVLRDPPEEDGNTVEVERFLYEKFQTLSRYRGNAMVVAIEFILRQPVRTVVNLLSLMARDETALADTVENAKPDSKVELQRALIAQFSDIYARLHTDSDDLYRTDSGKFAAFLAEFLTRNDLWSTGHTLLPDLASDDVNLIFLVFAGMAGGYQALHALDYMLRICQFREVAVHYGRDLLDAKKLRGTIDYLALNRPGSLLELGRHMTVILRGADKPTAKALRSGTTLTLARRSRDTEATIRRLYGDYGTLVGPCPDSAPEFIRPFRNTVWEKTKDNKTARGLGEWYNTADSLLARLPSETATSLAALPFSRILKHSGERPTYASIHNVLGALADIVASPDRIKAILKNSAEIRAYAVMDFQDAEPPEDIEDDDKDDTSGLKQDQSADYLFYKALKAWRIVMAKTPPLPPYVMARIWTRFFYGLSAQDDDLDAKHYYLGHLLHRQIILFLNSIYVEELLHLSDYDKNVSLKNPVTRDTEFLRNLPSRKDRPPFFNAIARCPLWAAYLDPNAEVTCKLFSSILRKVVKVTYEVGETEVEFDNLFHLFNSVAVPEPQKARQANPGRQASKPRQGK